jgi:uncharacterized membrane protein
VVGSSAIMIGTLYLSHGVSLRTSVSLVGTLISLSLTGLLGLLFTTVGRFTGLGDESAPYLASLGLSIDLRGLLLAGLVIGALNSSWVLARGAWRRHDPGSPPVKVESGSPAEVVAGS